MSLPLNPQALEAAQKRLEGKVKWPVEQQAWFNEEVAAAVTTYLEAAFTVEERRAPWRRDPTLPLGEGEHKQTRLASPWQDQTPDRPPGAFGPGQIFNPAVFGEEP